MKIARRFKDLIGEAPRTNQTTSGWRSRSAPSGRRPTDDSQRCPACGGTLFRTGHDLRLEPSADQKAPLEPTVDHAAADAIVYE